MVGGAITTPQCHREEGVWIGFVQIEKSGCPIDPHRKSRTRHSTAHRGRFPCMVSGLRSCECRCIGSYSR